MLHRDTSARFEKSGLWIFAEYRFVSGRLRSAKGWSVARAKSLLSKQAETPVILYEDASRRRAWWLFRDEIYWEEEGLTEVEVKALALERLTKNGRRIQRAVAMMEQSEALKAPARAPIPDEVKAFVWNRDAGRCVRCHGNQRLEFDHIIPLAFGGATSARNLQLLCETCNREKGASIA